MRAVAKEPDRRFQTALDFQAALQSLDQNQSPPTPGASAIPAAELAELETRLARAIGPIARRLVPDAARRYGTISEIRQALAAQIEDPKHRADFLKTSSATSAATVTHTSTVPVSFDIATLDRLAQALAPHLGPIAKVVVSRAARTAGNLEDLQNTLAAEIPSAEDRRRFLAGLRSPL